MVLNTILDGIAIREKEIGKKKLEKRNRKKEMRKKKIEII